MPPWLCFPALWREEYLYSYVETRRRRLRLFSAFGARCKSIELWPFGAILPSGRVRLPSPGIVYALGSSSVRASRRLVVITVAVPTRSLVVFMFFFPC